MKRIKWLGLAVLLSVGVSLLASTPVQAGKGQGGQSSPGLELYNTGVEPLATGQCALTKPRLAYYEWGYAVYSYQVTISCQNLTPGATYRASVQVPGAPPDLYTTGEAFTAKPNGTGAASFRADMDMYRGDYLAVDRLDSDGPVTVLYAAP
jgi:hypothetical protein